MIVWSESFLKKTIFEKQELVTNFETGEISSETVQTVVRTSKEPPYIKLYIDDVIRLYGLPKGESKILFELVKRMNYQGEIVINAAVKRDIAKKLELGGAKPEQVISNSMAKLVKNDILCRKDTGVYITNPHVFAKGDWADIQDLRDSYIEMKIKYSAAGREMSTKVINK
jgi:hypothetical protein